MKERNILKDLYFRHTLLASTVLTVVVIFIFFGPLKFGKKKQKTALRVLVSGTRPLVRRATKEETFRGD
jgi:hypothetical protein